MARTSYRTGLKTRFLAQLSPPLSQALEQIAQALPSDLDREASSVPAFFHSFMDGFWTPFEEVCRSDSKQLKDANETARTLKHTLTKRLDQDQRKLLDQFCDALNARNTDELEHAFLVGYQTAIRLMLMGLLPMNSLLQEEPPHEE